jgi:threonine dehydrogenase-like Zn-dependent dehydrogenase
MKAAVLTGIRSMEVREVPDPELVSPHDVMVRMGALGVCGSDVLQRWCNKGSGLL